MTDADAKEIKEKLDLILEFLGLGKNPVITHKEVKEMARKDVLQFKTKQSKKAECP